MMKRRQTGFTLTEMILVIVITGILAVVVGPIVVEPINAYFDSSRRADLVYTADSALRRMARDVHQALPYSIRLDGSGTSVEMIDVKDVARYRENGGAASRRLQFGGGDDEFNILGEWLTLTKPYAAAANEQLVVFNLGGGGYDAYNGDSVIHSAGDFQVSSETYSIGGTNYTEDKVEAINATTFPFDVSSPSHRIYLIDGETSYGCTGGGFYRYSGYGFGAAMPSLGSISGGDLLADNVSACSFSYDPGSASRPAMLIMSLEITRDGETVRLLHQVHVSNAT